MPLSLKKFREVHRETKKRIDRRHEKWRGAFGVNKDKNLLK